MAAAKATLESVMTIEADEQLNSLGKQLANGLNQLFNEHGCYGMHQS